MASDEIIIVEQDGTQRPTVQDAVDSITKLLREGETVQVIAARLNLDPQNVLAVRDNALQVQKAEEDNGQKLRSYLELVEELLDIAHYQTKSDPHANNIYSFTALVEIARGLLQDIDSRRDPKVVHETLMTGVMHPFCQELIKVMTAKLAEVRKELVEITDQSRHDQVIFLLEDILRTFGVALSEGLRESQEKSELILQDNKKKTSNTRRKS